MATVVLAGQAFEAHQRLEGLTQIGGTLGGHAGQAQMTGMAATPHQQADIGTAGQLDGGIA